MLHRFPAGSSWKCIRHQDSIRQFLKVSDLTFVAAKRSNCTRMGKMDSNIRQIGDMFCTMSSTLMLRTTEESTGTFALESLLASKEGHTQQELSTLYARPLPPDPGEVECFHVSGPSWAPAWPSSWPGFPVHLVCFVLETIRTGAMRLYCTVLPEFST